MAAEFNYHFEWDLIKATANQRKHHITFELAATVFYDPLMVSIADSEHSKTEERWLTMGLAENNKLLVLVHTYQDSNSQKAVVRIISARLATKHEQHHYEVTI